MGRYKKKANTFELDQDVIDAYIVKNGLGASGFSKRLCYSQSWWCMRKKRGYYSVSADSAERIADLLGCDISKIIKKKPENSGYMQEDVAFDEYMPSPYEMAQIELLTEAIDRLNAAIEKLEKATRELAEKEKRRIY